MIIRIAATSQFSTFSYFIFFILNFLINYHGCTIIGMFEMLISSTRSKIIEIAEMDEISIFIK